MAQLKGFHIDPSWFQQIEEFIQDNRNNEKNFKFGMDAIVMLYANVTLGEAQRRSLGSVDPQENNRAAAWKVPVRRITGEYFGGWYARRIGLGHWVVGNTSREAYYIEFGINHVATGLTDSAGNRVRVRRPILKLAVIQAIQIANRTRMDINAYSRLLGQGIYHSPDLYATPSHGANRAYPIGGELTQALGNISKLSPAGGAQLYQ